MRRFRVIGFIAIAVVLVGSLIFTSLNKTKQTMVALDEPQIKIFKEITSVEDLREYFRQYMQLEKFYVDSKTVRAEEMVNRELKNDTVAASPTYSGDAYSGTNNRVDGIEEGDSTVTDGKYIYTIKSQEVVVIDVNTLEVVNKINIKNTAYPHTILLHDQILVVTYSDFIDTEDVLNSKTMTKTALYDITNPVSPKLMKEVGQDGYLTGLRQLDDYLYIVTSLTPNYWILEENPDVDLRPATYDSINGMEFLPIEKVSILPESNGLNYIIVSALDLSRGASATLNTESYLGNSGQMYMSNNAIYIAAKQMYHSIPIVRTSLIVEDTTNKDETSIYKISINKNEVKMVAETSVKGNILNQYSMDEHDGYFRVVTTEGSSWMQENDSKNHLFILDQLLKEVGSLTDLAQGERVYSARFMGEKVYIVTFKETDPLFVIDTTNPSDPVVLGELKIPGFSNYLHPIGENYLLGIGFDTEVQMPSTNKEPIVLTKGMKLSLFNVTDMSNPLEQQSVIIGGRGTYSIVLYDYKALFRDTRNGYYGFPVTIYEEIPNSDQLQYVGTGAQIYKVTDAGISLVGDLIEPARLGEQYEDYYHTVRRLIYIEDKLFAISDWKITSYDLKTFTKLQTAGL